MFLEIDLNNSIGKSKNLTLISGPCAIESEELCLLIADHICDLIQDLSKSYQSIVRKKVAAYFFSALS